MFVASCFNKQSKQNALLVVVAMGWGSSRDVSLDRRTTWQSSPLTALHVKVVGSKLPAVHVKPEFDGI